MMAPFSCGYCVSGAPHSFCTRRLYVRLYSYVVQAAGVSHFHYFIGMNVANRTLNQAHNTQSAYTIFHNEIQSCCVRFAAYTGTYS